jgi:hypothetical protein
LTQRKFKVFVLIGFRLGHDICVVSAVAFLLVVPVVDQFFSRKLENEAIGSKGELLFSLSLS